MVAVLRHFSAALEIPVASQGCFFFGEAAYNPWQPPPKVQTVSDYFPTV
jgi:hypothetical protein